MAAGSDWSRGYPVAMTYPPAWHSFQSPAHLRMICALMGAAWDVGPDSPLSIAEVGCATGYTASILAAGSPHWQVVGLDYSPAQITAARSLAARTGLSNVRFLEVDLAELDGRDLDALPEFDVVTVHGLWSWVSDSVREGIVRLLRRRLKPGGVALMTYNALPGAAGGLALWRLVRETLLRHGGDVGGLDAARKIVRDLVATEAVHLPPSSWRTLLIDEALSPRDGYLLHEFLTAHWRPEFFADVAHAIGGARCDFVGSATIDDNFPQLSLSPAQNALWEAADGDTMRQLLLDVCVPRAFRRDVFMRGLRRVPADAAVDEIVLAPAALWQNGEVVLRTQAGEARLPSHVMDQVLPALAENPHPVKSLRALPGCVSVTRSELLVMLVGSGLAVPLWRHSRSGPDWDGALAAARRLNAVAAEEMAPHGVGQGQMGLATPMLGGALRASALELAVARHAADRIARGMVPLEAGSIAAALLPGARAPEPAVLAELEEAVARVLRERLPIWRSFHVVPSEAA